MKLLTRTRALLSGMVGELEEVRCRRMVRGYDLNGYRRVYFLHIRKTGGTSLNHMFLALSGRDPAELYQELARRGRHRMAVNGLVYVGWQRRYINRGNYFYAFSHVPQHRLDLPEHTFTVTCFRDPVRRVISHYNMLMGLRVSSRDHPCMVEEGPWLGEGFGDFLDRIPPEHLMRQLFMFSEQFDVAEALERVRRVSQVIFLDQFNEGVEQINIRTGLALEPIHMRRAGYKADIPDNQCERLRQMLQPEYEFLNAVRQSG